MMFSPPRHRHRSEGWISRFPTLALAFVAGGIAPCPSAAQAWVRVAETGDAAPGFAVDREFSDVWDLGFLDDGAIRFAADTLGPGVVHAGVWDWTADQGIEPRLLTDQLAGIPAESVPTFINTDSFRVFPGNAVAFLGSVATNALPPEPAYRGILVLCRFGGTCEVRASTEMSMPAPLTGTIGSFSTTSFCGVEPCQVLLFDAETDEVLFLVDPFGDQAAVLTAGGSGTIELFAASSDPIPGTDSAFGAAQWVEGRSLQGPLDFRTVRSDPSGSGASTFRVEYVRWNADLGFALYPPSGPPVTPGGELDDAEVGARSSMIADGSVGLLLSAPFSSPSRAEAVVLCDPLAACQLVAQSGDAVDFGSGEIAFFRRDVHLSEARQLAFVAQAGFGIFGLLTSDDGAPPRLLADTSDFESCGSEPMMRMRLRGPDGHGGWLVEAQFAIDDSGGGAGEVALYRVTGSGVVSRLGCFGDETVMSTYGPMDPSEIGEIAVSPDGSQLLIELSWFVATGPAPYLSRLILATVPEPEAVLGHVSAGLALVAAGRRLRVPADRREIRQPRRTGPARSRGADGASTT